MSWKGDGVYSWAMVSDARAFIQTDWKAVERNKERHWTENVRREDAATGIRLSAALRAQVKRVLPDWPSEAERREDLETHLRLDEVIRRAAPCGR
jgi:hypothetical protein